MKHKILFCGGGTGGHIVPNVALMEQLPATEFAFGYLASGENDKRILAPVWQNLAFYREIPTVKLQRKWTLQNLKIPFLLKTSIAKAEEALTEWKPELVFSKGGYAGLPVCIAAHRQKIPVFLHESDLSMGLSNRISLRFADRLFTTFDVPLKTKKQIVTGSPIRQSVRNASRPKGLYETGFSGVRPLLTVVGGSSGAQILNAFVEQNLTDLTKRYDVFLVAGKGKTLAKQAPHFKQTEYTNALLSVLKASDAVISRAGSNTVCELVTLNVPTLFVPLQRASRGEQTKNAAYFCEKGCARMLNEKDFCLENVWRELEELRKNKERYQTAMQKMQIDGTKTICKEIQSFFA